MKWINVAEKLPETTLTVLIWLRQRDNWSLGYYSKNYRTFIEVPDDKFCSPDYWMEIEPPNYDQ